MLVKIKISMFLYFEYFFKKSWEIMFLSFNIFFLFLSIASLHFKGRNTDNFVLNDSKLSNPKMMLLFVLFLKVPTPYLTPGSPTLL